MPQMSMTSFMCFNQIVWGSFFRISHLLITLLYKPNLLVLNCQCSGLAPTLCSQCLPLAV